MRPIGASRLHHGRRLAHSERTGAFSIRGCGLGSRRVEDAIDGILRVESVGQRMLALVRHRGIKGWPDSDGWCPDPVPRAARALAKRTARAALVGRIGARGPIRLAYLFVSVSRMPGFANRGRDHPGDKHRKHDACLDTGWPLWQVGIHSGTHFDVRTKIGRPPSSSREEMVPWERRALADHAVVIGRE